MARVNKEVIRRQAHLYFPSFLRGRSHAIMLDHWIEGKQLLAVDADGHDLGRPYRPAGQTAEYEDLGTRAPEPWAGLVVTSLAQTAYVDGIRAPGENENLKVWETMERNSWSRRQIAIHRSSIGHGAAFGVVLPGRDPLTGDKMSLMRGKSAKRLQAFYDDDDDEWCQFAIEAMPYAGESPGEPGGWHVMLYDDDAIHYLDAKGEALDITDWEYISYEPHPFKVPPVARCANRLDNEGYVHGEIEPIIPLLRAIDQDKFDRLIVQKFGAWKVRYIAGMAKPTSKQQENYQAMQLKITDLLVSSDHQTNFGTLDGTDPEAFVKVHDADLRTLSAVAQIPPHHLLGLSSNLQAEALAAAEAGLQRKSGDFRTSAGEFHEQMARLVAIADGNPEEARLAKAQVRWRDTESRSMTQAADALFKLASGLKVPVEMLWEKIPGWTDSDTERAKKLIEDGSIEQILAALADINGTTGEDTAGTSPNQPVEDTGGNAG